MLVLERKYRWDAQARPNQLPPDGDWHTWLILSGRGWGKTRTGAEWVKTQVDTGKCKRLALVAEDAGDARDVMVEGESGLLAISHPRRRPHYEPSKRRLTWPNGAMATLYSADDPDALRGPQHDGAWCDEVAKWRRAQEAMDNLRMGLRLGVNPQCVITTTPRPIPIIRSLISRSGQGVHVTKGTTYENLDNLSASFRDTVLEYKGTRIGRQELEAEVLEDTPGALWTMHMIDAHRATTHPDLTRVVVGLDPEAASTEESAETGIIVAGKGPCSCKGNLEAHYFITADRTIRGTPNVWGTNAVTAYTDAKADLMVGEVNNGGDMVGAVVKGVADSMAIHVAFKKVHASRGKLTRAEPIALLYEQCVAQGTIIDTARGPVPIEQVTTSDMVWTREGLRRVLWSGQTGVKPTVEVRFGAGCLRCTEDHPVYVEGKGFTHAGQLVPNHDRMVTWNTLTSAPIAAPPSQGKGRAVALVRLVLGGKKPASPLPCSVGERTARFSRRLSLLSPLT